MYKNFKVLLSVIILVQGVAVSTIFSKQIIINITSDSIVAGFAEGVKPVGTEKAVFGILKTDGRSMKFGEDVNKFKKSLNIITTVKNGLITDWKNIDKIFENIFKNILKVNPVNYSLLITDSPVTPQGNRDKLASILYEEFKVKDIKFMDEATLAILETGKPSGVYVDISNSQIKITTVINGRISTSIQNITSETLTGQNHDGIHTLGVGEAIMKCDVDVRKDLYGNVVLSGGSSMFEGIAARMTKEIKSLSPPSMLINVVQPPVRKDNLFIGAKTHINSNSWQTFKMKTGKK